MDINVNKPYIKTDDNTLINQKYIRWIHKINECMEICIKSDGCIKNDSATLHKICKISSPINYEKLNNYFERT
jgi:hypothetical protein